MSEKTYIKGVFIKESKYGTKMSIKVKELCEQLTALQNEKGYVNVEIKPRKETGEHGNTHYMELDTWKPTPKEAKEPEYKESQDVNDPMPF